jgi:hypothetical protein
VPIFFVGACVQLALAASHGRSFAVYYVALRGAGGALPECHSVHRVTQSRCTLPSMMCELERLLANARLSTLPNGAVSELAIWCGVQLQLGLSGLERSRSLYVTVSDQTLTPSWACSHVRLRNRHCCCGRLEMQHDEAAHTLQRPTQYSVDATTQAASSAAARGGRPRAPARSWPAACGTSVHVRRSGKVSACSCPCTQPVRRMPLHRTLARRRAAGRQRRPRAQMSGTASGGGRLGKAQGPVRRSWPRKAAAQACRREQRQRRQPQQRGRACGSQGAALHTCARHTHGQQRVICSSADLNGTAFALQWVSPAANPIACYASTGGGRATALGPPAPPRADGAVPAAATAGFRPLHLLRASKISSAKMVTAEQRK